MNKRRPLTPDEIRRIRDLRADGLPDYEIAAKLRRSRRQVRNALNVSTEQRKVAPITEATPIIEGVTANEVVSAESLWEQAYKVQDATAALVERKSKQRIVLPDEPIGIAFLSDLHFGSSGTDYRAAKRDAELVRETPGLHAVFHGDGFDNWVAPKLLHLQRGQAINHDGELRLFADWIGILGKKLLAVVSGNHDLFTYSAAGIDPIQQMIQGLPVLYDKYQIVVNLEHGGVSRTLAVRHKWKGSSVYNALHGQMVGWERMGVDYDIAVGGHTHIGTLHSTFTKHGRRRFAILTGAYKFTDEHARAIGYAPTHDRGCGALVLIPGGDMFFTENLTVAAEFLRYLRERVA